MLPVVGDRSVADKFCCWRPPLRQARWKATWLAVRLNGVPTDDIRLQNGENDYLHCRPNPSEDVAHRQPRNDMSVSVNERPGHGRHLT